MKYRKIVTTGAIVTAGYGAIKLVNRPITGTSRSMIDWDALTQQAYKRAEEDGPAIPQSIADRLNASYTEMAATLLAELGTFCPPALTATPVIQVVDRRGFIDLNITQIKRYFSGIEADQAKLSDTRLNSVNRALSSRYLGEAFGVVGRRVLGQYDPVFTPQSISAAGALPPPTLYMVEPNIIALEKQFNVPGDDIRKWIMMHELTHTWQFEHHPWLHEYFSTTIDHILTVQKIHKRMGIGDVPGVVRSELDTISQVQTFMSILEGHGNFVTHGVAKTLLPSFPVINAALERRQGMQTVTERIMYALTGVSIKLRQYIVGEAFLTAISERYGNESLAALWESTESLPTSNELKHPDQWYMRVAQPKRRTRKRSAPSSA